MLTPSLQCSSIFLVISHKRRSRHQHTNIYTSLLKSLARLWACNYTYLVSDQPSSLYPSSLDELEEVHHSLCLHPLHLSMCAYECASPANTITRGSTKLKSLSHTLAPLDSLAHDYNGLVARAHLHLLHQISHLQNTCCRLWHTILRPPHVLELSHSEAIITRRYGGLAVRDIHLHDNVVIAVFLCFEGYRVLSKQFTVSSSFRPVSVANFLQK